MEPRQEESKKAAEVRPEERKRRFRIVKLEERIAPIICGRVNPHTKCIGTSRKDCL